MPHTIEKLEARAQLDRALSALSEGLALAQDPLLGDDLCGIAAALAKCVQDVFKLKKVGIIGQAAPVCVKRSMDHLRNTLSLLQNGPSHNSVIGETTCIVAQCLALLYPVSGLIEQLKTVPRQADGSVIPGLEIEHRESSYVPAHPADEERRSTIRKVVEVDIGIQSGANFFTGFSLDISTGGLFISTYDVLPIGAKVNVNFSLPYGPVLSVDGTVRWLREFNEFTPEMVPGMGVQFDDLTDEDAELINEYMSEMSPIFFD